jgi:putative hemolysin
MQLFSNHTAPRSNRIDVTKRDSERCQLTVKLADTRALVEAAQRLRYRVFVDELGADIDRHDGRDVDQFDALCDHLVVIDELRDKVVGTYRILPPWGARQLGQRYCETEFRIDALRPILNELFEGHASIPRIAVASMARCSRTFGQVWVATQAKTM